MYKLSNKELQDMDEHQYQTSPNTKDNLSRKSEARLLTENKVNTIIADLIEKTKILAEELKNSNKIAAELMLQNSDLRKKYTNLKDKFLQFLNDEEIIDYMESDQNLQQSSGLIMKIKQYENQAQTLKVDNQNLDALNQKQQQQIQDLQVKCSNLEKQSKSNDILKNIDQNKDLEIKNLKEQIHILQEQVHHIDASRQQHSEQHTPQNQFYQTQLLSNKSSQSQPKEKMSRAYSQIQLSNQNNQSGLGNNTNNFYKKSQNQQSHTAFNSPGNQNSGRDSSGNYIIPQMSNNPSQQTLEYNPNGTASNQRRPLSQKNNYYNRNFNLDYNELLYSEQPNEFEDQEIYAQQQQHREEVNKNQGYQQQNQSRPYSYSQSQQQYQQHQGQYNNNPQFQQQYHNQNYPQTVFNNTQQYTNENQENNGSFENRQLNSSESNRLILSGGAGKSLIDPQKAFGRHQKSPSYMDPQQAAKYARSSALKKNQPIQKAPGLSAAYNKKKV